MPPKKKAVPALPDGVLAQSTHEVVNASATRREIFTFVVDVIVHNACDDNDSAVEQLDDALYNQIVGQQLDEFSPGETFVESYTVKLTSRKLENGV